MSKRAKKSDGGLTPVAPSTLDPHGDEFAYLVAKYAWSDGLAVNTIVKRLGWVPTSLHLMQVRRALVRAHGKFLSFAPPIEESLAKKLATKVNAAKSRKIRFTVVKDAIPNEPAQSLYGVVSAHAARLVAEIIHDMAKTTPYRQKHDLVICNAGGRTISQIVQALSRNQPVVERSKEAMEQYPKRLKFIAGNAGYLPTRFNQSANFLSVTMAELFGADHEAHPLVVTDKGLKNYQELVDRTVLFICGTGTSKTSLMAEHFKPLQIPEKAVGDLAFNLLDIEGRSVKLPPEAVKMMDTINPVMTIQAIQEIANRGRVLLVLDGEKPEDKTDISLAALKREYATDVVLGSKLAKAILNAY